ncbi:RNA methyltransferase substrate-binding domain-containing protein, partial [Pseudomonas syringae]|uniref:RNA methyltransferase substrate-binding domain-containing protein n=1 Tax=Pseudomonas syringae TaxID=317 RepID=UPI0034D763F9
MIKEFRYFRYLIQVNFCFSLWSLKHILSLADPFGVSVQKASRDTLEKLAGLPYHQGVVAAVRPHPVLNEKDLDALLTKKPESLL